MTRNLHHRMIALGEAHQQIRPAGNSKIPAANVDQNRVICEKQHQRAGRKTAECPEHHINDRHRPEHHVEDVTNRLLILLPVVL